MLRRTFLTGAAALLIVPPVTMVTAQEPTRWFRVQVLCDEGLPAKVLDLSDALGRVEVISKGRLVGCVAASFYVDKGRDEINLVPMALSYIVQGKKGDIQVNTYGQLAVLCKHRVTITELL